MKIQKDQKTEDFLNNFSRKPAPPELKEKILNEARRERAEKRVMTPMLWKVGLICSASILTFLLLDTFILPNQKRYIASLVGTQPVIRIQKQDESLLFLAKLLNMTQEAENMAWLKAKLLRKHKSNRNNRYEEFLRLKEELNEDNVGLVTRTIFNYTTGKKLERTLEKMKAAGEKLAIKEFEPDCRDEDNAALSWKGVEEILQIEREQRELLSKTLKEIFYNEPLLNGTRRKIEIMAEKNQRALLLIQDTGQKPCFKYNEDWDQINFEILVPRAIKAIQAFRLYGFDAVIKAENGRLTEALEQNCIGMQFSRKYLEEPLLINSLVAFAQMRAQLLFLRKIAAGKELATETLLNILPELETKPWRRGLVRSFKGEKILSLETGTKFLRGEYNITGVDVNFWDKIYYWIFRPVLKSEIVWSLNLYSEMEKAAELPYYQTYKIREKYNKRQEDIPWLFKLSGFLFPNLETAMFKEARLEADKNIRPGPGHPAGGTA